MRQTKEVQPTHAKVWMTEKIPFFFAFPFTSPDIFARLEKQLGESYALSLGWNYSQCE